VSGTTPNLPEPARRFTDQEVALVLQRAAEIEERRATTAPARGLTVGELRDIARDVGLSPDVIDEAIRTMQVGGRAPTRSLLGAPLSHKLVRGVPGVLGEESMQSLIRLLEEQVEVTGTVTQALGTVRWTSVGRGHKFDRTTQVSFSANAAETQIQVVQRYPSSIRAILHLVPGLWGGAIGGAVVASANVGGLAALGVAVVSVAGGAAIGRAIWALLSRRNAAQVQRIAHDLAEAARDLPVR